ncbi:MAG: NINE protein [Deferribacteraceae bacterium]|jgi:TM2 domain-containing membrane protein YozV|nr:NINE protein [Deferribacteraceae bacterium]
MLCPYCKEEIAEGAVKCKHCGTMFASLQRPANYKDKVAAGLLGILLGGIGVHKFYLGKAGLGIIYLLFCWTAIPAIIGLIEGIIYLTQSQEDFDAKYNSNLKSNPSRYST